MDRRRPVLRAERPADHRHPARAQGARRIVLRLFLRAPRAPHRAAVSAAARRLVDPVRRRMGAALAVVRVLLDQYRAVARRHRAREPERAVVARRRGAVLHLLAVRRAARPRARARAGRGRADRRGAAAARDRDAVVRLVLADLLPDAVPDGSARRGRAARRRAAPRPARARALLRRGDRGRLRGARGARVAASVVPALSRGEHAAVQRDALQRVARAVHVDRRDRAARARPRATRADPSRARLCRHRQLHDLSDPPERAVRALAAASEPLPDGRARVRRHARVCERELVRLRAAPDARRAAAGARGAARASA